MDYARNIFDYLNDSHLVYSFQKLCGLEKFPSADSAPNGTTAKASDNNSFLTGDKGIDSLFSAVDRDSRFISQDELVSRHIDHIKQNESPDSSVSSSRDISSGRIATRNDFGSSDRRKARDRPESDKEKGSLPKHRIRNKTLYYLFRFGSSLGYEAFYATFFPVWTWNIDGAVCRRVTTIWVATMYIGQLLKDLIRLPRPSPKIVVQMEPWYVSEYGMPSTHAMVGFSVPFSLLYFCAERYQFPFPLGLAVCATWCLLICSSRIYLGMHSIMDIIGGLFLVSILFTLMLPFADAFDNFQLTSPLSPIVMTILYVIPSIFYPQNISEEISAGQWGPTWADTVTILAAGYGIALGSWLNYQTGLISAPTLTNGGVLLPPPYPIKWPSTQELTFCVLRAVVGLACLATVRIAGKTMAYLAVCRYYNKDPNEVKGKNLVKVELPVKFFTYSAIGMASTFFIPALFRGLRIERDTMYTEV